MRQLAERLKNLEEQFEVKSSGAAAQEQLPRIESGRLSGDDEVLLERISVIERCLGDLQASPEASAGGRVSVGDLESINGDLRQLWEAIEGIEAKVRPTPGFLFVPQLYVCTAYVHVSL